MNWKTLEQQAYTPYSGKPRACIIESKTGKNYAGVRIENISSPITIPAIQAACCICLSDGEVPSTVILKNENLEQLNFWADEFDLQIEKTDTPPVSDIKNLLQTQNSDFSSLRLLKELLNKAVTPNSNFPVASLLFVENGFFEGVNIEVSEFTKGLCAERVAIAKAFAAGFTNFTHIEVHTKKGEVSSPCGACRQVILEHLPFHTVRMHHADGTLSEHLTVDLLPFSFKSSDLKK